MTYHDPTGKHGRKPRRVRVTYCDSDAVTGLVGNRVKATLPRPDAAHVAAYLTGKSEVPASMSAEPRLAESTESDTGEAVCSRQPCGMYEAPHQASRYHESFPESCMRGIRWLAIPAGGGTAHDRGIRRVDHGERVSMWRLLQTACSGESGTGPQNSGACCA